MSARIVSASLACTVVCFISAHLTDSQEATSANLPDQFQTGEMIQVHKTNKKKTGSISKAVATAPNQDTAPVPEQPLTTEEVPTQIAPPEEKKSEPNQSGASMPPRHKPASPTEQAPPAEEPAITTVMRPEKKHRARRPPRPAVQPEAATISAPVPVSLSVAQSMAITAPLPDYTYEMKRRNLAGSGTCIVTVDTATGTVTNAIMFKSTGNPLLDRLTIQTFKTWRFKPGTVSEVRVPISYE